jgi:hypothetical protein
VSLTQGFIAVFGYSFSSKLSAESFQQVDTSLHILRSILLPADCIYYMAQLEVGLTFCNDSRQPKGRDSCRMLKRTSLGPLFQRIGLRLCLLIYPTLVFRFRSKSCYLQLPPYITMFIQNPKKNKKSRVETRTAASSRVNRNPHLILILSCPKELRTAILTSMNLIHTLVD